MKKRRPRRDHHHHHHLHQSVATDIKVGNEEDGDDDDDDEDDGEIKFSDMLRDKLRLKGPSARQESKRSGRHDRRVENGFVDGEDDDDDDDPAVSQQPTDTSSVKAFLLDEQEWDPGCEVRMPDAPSSVEGNSRCAATTATEEVNASAASPLDNHTNHGGPRSPPSPSNTVHGECRPRRCSGDASVHVPLTTSPLTSPSSSSPSTDESGCIRYVAYESELQMPDIMRLIQKDLSEPYSIYTYRYFIHNWPKLCFLAMDGDRCIGAIVCKLDMHRAIQRGYIAMLAVDENFRKRKIGSNLVLKAIHAMVMDDADEVVLETEVSNKPALRLYENLGFVRDKRLFRYYLNGVDALRLKLWVR